MIPSAKAYHDQNYPVDHLYIVGLKTTCKDRWRQVLNEGTRVPRKHLITLQRGISSNQLAEMAAANVALVVPRGLQREYPAESGMVLRTIDDFINEIRAVVAA